MKILQLGKFYPIKGGVEKVMYDLMEGLSSRGIRCDMLCASAEIKIKEKININENAFLYVEPTLKELAKTKISPALIRKLRQIQHEYDIIHIHHPDPMAALALFSSNYKGKVILHWHSDILSQKIILKAYAWLQTWLIKRADLILGTTPLYIAESPYLKKVQTKIDYLPIGIKDESNEINLDIYTKISTKYSNKKIIFSLGRLVEYKGFEYLIKAAKYLDESFVILIGGTGGLKEKLSELIKKNSLDKKVELLGYLSSEEVLAFFKLCDIYCLSSIMKTEAFAIVQIEAMSFGKPIVSVNIPGSGVQWVNADNITGINVEIKNPEEIATAIKNIFKSTETYHLYSINARKRYEHNFTLELMTDKALSFYKKVLD
ncbi:MAG: glycosyltransferase [Arachidicoccus sp.]|nr:glycosyltransferase [Arachidicoccus sp.]